MVFLLTDRFLAWTRTNLYFTDTSMLNSCLSYSFCVSRTHTHTHTNVWTLLHYFKLNTCRVGPSGFFGVMALTWKPEGWRWISRKEVWTQGQGKDGLSANILPSYFYPRTSHHNTWHIQTNILSQKEKKKWMFLLLFTFCACVFSLLSQFFENFTHIWFLYML